MKAFVRLFSPLLLMIIASGCQRKPTLKTMAAPAAAAAPIVVQQKSAPVKTTYYSNMFSAENQAGAIRPSEEINGYIKKLNPHDVLSCAYDLLFIRGYSIEEKCFLLESCKKRLEGDELSVIEFFSTALMQHASFLKETPLTDLNNSLVSYAPEHADFLKEDEEMTEMLWPIDEIYALGNNLLQEAIFLKNEAAVDYLLAKGADPRHLCDARGTMLALEWVDKHEIPAIADKLAQTLNKLDPDSKTTILDELIYTDPHAAILVRKYGGKLSSELA